MMTDNQKNQIKALRQSGLGYTEVANRIGIPKDTVKSFCQRNNLAGKRAVFAGENTCPQCGGAVAQTPGRKKRRFCTDACRIAWWAKHHDDIQSGNRHDYVCEICGKAFSVYGKVPRKYCSHGCYVAARSKGGERL